MSTARNYRAQQRTTKLTSLSSKPKFANQAQNPAHDLIEHDYFEQKPTAEPTAASRRQPSTVHRLWQALLALVALIVLVLLAPQGIQAATNTPFSDIAEVQSGSLLLITDRGYENSLRLETKVDMQISGMVARVSLIQRFQNHSSDFAEGVYVFPLPENAAVNALSMRIGERLIIGEIKPRQQAKQIYQAAKQAGKQAALVEQERPNLFTSSVANIPPGEFVDVEIAFFQTAHYENGEFSLKFPLTITPRFTGQNRSSIPGEKIYLEAGLKEPPHQTDVSDTDRITPPILLGKNSHTHTVQMQITLDAGLPLISVISNYHHMDVSQQGSVHNLQLSNQKTPMDRDFKLSWVPDVGQQPNIALFTEHFENEDYVLMMVMPPQHFTEDQTLPREMIFVIDTSGSMGGISIRQAKSALSLALERLDMNDRFNIIEFNSQTRAFFDNSVFADPNTVTSAIQDVQRLQADGGTVMAPALELALSGTTPNGYLKQVIFITDGAVGNEATLFNLIAEKLGAARLFTVGIGSAPNSYFMTEAALSGRGTFTYIANINEVHQEMHELFTKLENPILADIKIEWPQDTLIDMQPQTIPDLYQGDPVVISAKLKQLHGNVRFSGIVANNYWEKHLSLELGHAHKGIATTWARQAISGLTRKHQYGLDQTNNQQLITDLALKHHLVSKYTSLVAVDHTPVRDESSELMTKEVANLLPKGSSMHQVPFPSGATSARANLLIAIILSLFVCYLLRAQHRPRQLP